MSRTTRLKISIALKFAVFLCVAAALFFDPSADLKFFTNQSNLLIGALDLVFAFMLIGRIKDGSLELTTPHYIMQLIATVAITLTGIIFCFVSAASLKSLTRVRLQREIRAAIQNRR